MKNVFIVAEIGCNHNGSIELARKMIEEAKKRNSAELIEYHVCGIEEVNL